jgi:enoyl-CoA hydratase
MSNLISVEGSDGVAVVSLKTLTMPPSLFDEIGEIFRDLAKQRNLRAVVVDSAEKVFTYGLDLPAAMGVLGPFLGGGTLAGPRFDLLAVIRRWQGCFEAVASCPVPVIAAIHSWCIGGGLDLVSACDIRLASRDAKFSLRETRIAIVADLGSLQRLPPIIGQGATRELAFTGKDIDADRALQIGLVNAVFEDREALRQAAMDMAKEIAGNAPLTVRGVKDVLNFGADKPVSVGLEYVAAWNSAFVASEDLGEALAAFMSKRTPNYKGQ